MLSVKYLPYVQSFLLSLFMSFIMSGIITLNNLGFAEHFMVIWMRAWISAFVIAYLTVMFVFPFARRGAMRICSKPSEEA